MEQVQVSATFPNTTARLAEFKELAAEALKLTADDPGVLQYDWFFNADESKCVVHETYVNSDAILNHVAMVGDLLGRLVDAGGGLELEIFGSLSPEVATATAAMNPTVHSFFQGK
jgi:quinol monooxygenase YgiN